MIAQGAVITSLPLSFEPSSMVLTRPDRPNPLDNEHGISLVKVN
jgi:hypothetical protein